MAKNTIGANAFQYCSRLKKITLSKSLISIGADAFTETPIQEIDIPDNVREIGSGAFMGCKSLSSVKLSQNIERIDAYAFGYCESLTEISIPRSLKTSASAYYPKRMYDYQGGIFIGSNNLRSVTFEDGTTTIINHLFRYAGGLEKIVIPDTVTTIKEAAFQNCTNLKEVTLSKKLEKTEGYIFDGCSAIESISIPDTVSVVGTIASLWEANMDLLGTNPVFNLYDKEWRIYSKSPIMPPHYAGADAVISNSLVTEGCVVHGLVRHSVLYAGVRIEPGAVVEDSIIMPNSVIERGAVVQKTIVGENAIVGAKARVGCQKLDTDADYDTKLTGDITLVASAVRVADGLRIPKGMVYNCGKGGGFNE